MILNAIRIFFFILSLLYAGLLARDVAIELSQANGLLLADGTSPAGGDYINLFTVGALAASGRIGDIYDPDAFMAFQRTLIPANIGLRLWAYPPTSLIIALPFGAVGYFAGLAAWSLLGVAVLAAGARRIGLAWLDTALLVLSPAALSSIYFGQTGNLATGLLLFALAARRPADAGSAIAATLLTIKPQLGLLLPVLWAIQRRLLLIALTALLVLAFIGMSVVAFGPQAWSDYVHLTLPLLSELERHGSGAFTAMIPSVFMTLRILSGDAQVAQWVHLAAAVAVVPLAVWRMLRTTGHLQQSAILLAAAALVTPYIHIYDLAGVLAAALIALTLRVDRGGRIVAGLVLLVVWALPILTVYGNEAGVPVGPLVLLALLAIVSWPTEKRVER